MAQKTIVYWRDIPAQIIVKQGRKAAKRELPPRFITAIDACAMAVGARDSDAYLSQWRRGEPVECGDDLEAIADETLRALDVEYSTTRLKTLIESRGYCT